MGRFNVIWAFLNENHHSIYWDDMLIEWFPRPGESVPGHSFHMGSGGKGANQAVAAAKLGATVQLISKAEVSLNLTLVIPRVEFELFISLNIDGEINQWMLVNEADRVEHPTDVDQRLRFIVGNDLFGQWNINDLRKFGVDTAHVEKSETSNTATATIIVNAKGSVN
ncbi:hypothetical protein DICVIV_06337 [Dictyocaulus viviparus]|uniref:Carbohydrate kinase PfkB domain-containing protein n=1 Tax=Dictyocaulus viviparus TaxID=29172 RepID=A0A0D8XSS1_DICVI|nr:hypothetical protein DICVIV_06337 [Dictyocaulus viviparus]